MTRTHLTLTTLLLLASVNQAQALDLDAPSNALREVSSYLDKACTVVQTVGQYADGAQSAGTVVSTLEGLIGSGTGIGQALQDGTLQVKRVLVNGRFVCTLNEMTNYAASVVDVNTWRDLGKDAMRNAFSGSVTDAFGDMPQTELEKNLTTLNTSLQNNVNAFRRNVDKISRGYFVANMARGDAPTNMAVNVAMLNPGSAVNITTANIAGQEAVKEKLLLMLQRKEQLAANEAMDGQTKNTAALSADLLGNGMPDSGMLNQIDDRASKATSSRESWEALTNAVTTAARADVVYGERFGQALSNIARGQALSNYEMSRKAEEEYDQALADVESTREGYNEMFVNTMEDMEDANEALQFSETSVASGVTPDTDALNSLLEF